MPKASLVSIVEDDQFFRESLRRLIKSQGYIVEAFSSAADFLGSSRLIETACVIADVNMPAMSGIELHRHLLARGRHVPATFITAHASDDRARSEAASAWTVAYLTKPFSEDELLGAITAGLKWKPGP